MNHHFEDSHQRKAEHELYSQAIAERVVDLIHLGIDEEDEDGFQARPDDMYLALAQQSYYLQPLLAGTEQLLYATR